MNSREEAHKDGIFTMNRVDFGELSLQQLEIYLSEARRQHSLYVTGLLRKLWWRLGAGCIRLAAQLGAAGSKIRMALGMVLPGFSQHDIRYGVCSPREQKMPSPSGAKCV